MKTFIARLYITTSSLVRYKLMRCCFNREEKGKLSTSKFYTFSGSGTLIILECPKKYFFFFFNSCKTC